MSQQRFCQIHNIPLDPTWPVCPYCLKEGRVPPPGGAPAGAGATVPGAPPMPPTPGMGGPPGGPGGFGGPPGGGAPTMRGGPGGPPGGPGGPAGGYGGDATRVGGAPGGGAYDPTRRAPGPGGGVGATVIDQPPEARAWLVVKEGDGAGQWHPIAKKAGAPTDEIAIGRDRENDVVLIEGKVSRFHTKVRLEKDDEGNEQYVVWDLASSNGTLVNGRAVRAPTPLEENDTIQVGATTFVLKVVG